MGELGKDAQKYHEELGVEAKKSGIEQIYTYGELSKFTAQSFGRNAQHFLDQETQTVRLATLSFSPASQVQQLLSIDQAQILGQVAAINIRFGPQHELIINKVNTDIVGPDADRKSKMIDKVVQ